jgi:methyl-accepting chemotaxis protein
MSDIRISLDQVSETAEKLRSLNQSMYDELNQMKTDMNLLNSSWVSDGSDEIRTRFNMFANRFETERERIEEYARFLDLTVESYEALESSITSNASGMQY